MKKLDLKDLYQKVLRSFFKLRINLLEKQIKQKINRLEQSELTDWEKEEAQLAIYQQLFKTYEIPF